MKQNICLCLLLAIISGLIHVISGQGQDQEVKTVIVIDNVVKEFSTKTSCDLSSWSHKLENACTCCLIKKAADLDKGKKPSEILNECLKSASCDSKIVYELLQKEGITSAKDKEELIRNLIISLYDKSIIIKQIEPINIEFTADGSFTEQSALNFLVRASQEKKLKAGDDFGNSSCLTAKNIMTEKGFQTLQLFLISSECSGKKVDYIFKEIATGTGEIINLQNSFLIPSLVPYLYPEHNEGFPSFILPAAYITYRYQNKDHYMALMLKAPGDLMSSLVRKYKADPTNTLKYISKAYFEVGFAMSNFHKKFMDQFKNLADSKRLLNPTYVHGDAHQSNIFYDENRAMVTFIDNERIASSSPKSPFWDIQYFIFMSMSLFLPPDIKNDGQFLRQWILTSIGSYLIGYISAYPSSVRRQLLTELKETFSNSANYTKNHNIFAEYKNNEKAFDDLFKFMSIFLLQNNGKDNIVAKLVSALHFPGVEDR